MICQTFVESDIRSKPVDSYVPDNTNYKYEELNLTSEMRDNTISLLYQLVTQKSIFRDELILYLISSKKDVYDGTAKIDQFICFLEEYLSNQDDYSWAIQKFSEFCGFYARSLEIVIKNRMDIVKYAIVYISSVVGYKRLEDVIRVRAYNEDEQQQSTAAVDQSSNSYTTKTLKLGKRQRSCENDETPKSKKLRNNEMSVEDKRILVKNVADNSKGDCSFKWARDYCGITGLE